MRQLEAELWCPACQTYYGMLYRIQNSEHVWVHQTDPAEIPQRCTRCEGVIQRSPG
jgi:hypothetical protein